MFTFVVLQINHNDSFCHSEQSEESLFFEMFRLRLT
jgi:hypothetical protein